MSDREREREKVAWKNEGQRGREVEEFSEVKGMFERVVEQDGREYVDNHLLVQKKMNLAASHGQMLR